MSDPVSINRARQARGLPIIHSPPQPGRRMRHAKTGTVVTVLHVHPHHVYARTRNGAHSMVPINQLAPITEDTWR